MVPRPRVLTCQGGTPASRRAAAVARELGALGVAEPSLGVGTAEEADRPTIVIDGCSSGCGSRQAAAQGLHPVATVDLSQVMSGASTILPRVLAERVDMLLQQSVPMTHPGRPRRPQQVPAPTAAHGHTTEDYLLAIDRLTSPAAACGALITDAPTLASHVSAVLGVTRPSAGEMLRKLEAGGLIHRGAQKELLLTPLGRTEADLAIRRQRLLEVFVSDVLGYEPAECYAHARRLGSAFDDDALARLERSLGAPARCPHGWPVDAVVAREEGATLRTLESLGAGEVARIARVAEEDEALLRQLAGLALTPGSEVVVEQLGADGVRRLSVGGRVGMLAGVGCQAVLVRIP